jgi:1,4-alpha-glucan branching enzyme
VARDTADRLTIAIRAPHAERVEIAGDFTRWAPLTLERLPGGWWQLRVPTRAGTHRVSVRVDGGRWLAPPGLPPVLDEFGGTVGLLVVQ